MARVFYGPKGPELVIDVGDSTYSIAQEFAGDAARFREIVACNPAAKTTELGTFAEMLPGQKFFVPLSWCKTADRKGLVFSRDEAAGWHDAGALPSGFTPNDLKIVNAMGRAFGGTGDDILVTFYEETGVSPRAITAYGTAPDGNPAYLYAGLNAGLSSYWDKKQNRRVYMIDENMGWAPGTWRKIVEAEPIAVQLQAIAEMWDGTFKSLLGESIGDRAARLGVSVAGMIHAMNFLPGRAAAATSANTALTWKGDAVAWNPINAALSRDGQRVTIADVDAHAQKKLTELAQGPKGELVSSARALRSSPQSLASLIAPYAAVYASLTKRAPKTSIGSASKRSGAAIFILIALAIAFAYYRYRRT